MQQNIPSSFLVTEDMHTSSGNRFVNLIIDVVVRVVLVNLIDLFGLLLFYVFDYDSLLMWSVNLSDWGQIFLSLFIIAVYYITMEALTQRTVGKLVTRTIVVNYDGTKPDLATIGVRTLCRFIPLDAFTFLGGNRGWHDTLSKTYVVDVRKFEEAVLLKDSFDQIGNHIETTNE